MQIFSLSFCENVLTSVSIVFAIKNPHPFGIRVSKLYWCPGGDLNSYTSRQRLLRPSCLPFHHLGWCSRWELNPHTHRAYASETYMSTIPSPEQSVFVWIYLFAYMYPSSRSAGSHFVETRSREYGFQYFATLRLDRTSTIPSPEQSVFVSIT